MVVEIGVREGAGERDADVEVVVEPLEAEGLADGRRRGVDRGPVDPIGDGRGRARETLDAAGCEERALEELDRVGVARDRRGTRGLGRARDRRDG
jgi:hypothetical protein